MIITLSEPLVKLVFDDMKIKAILSLDEGLSELAQRPSYNKYIIAINNILNGEFADNCIDLYYSSNNNHHLKDLILHMIRFIIKVINNSSKPKYRSSKKQIVEHYSNIINNIDANDLIKEPDIKIILNSVF